MKIDAIKRLNEWLPYWVKKPFAPVIRRRLIENRVFLDQYDALIRADAMTDAEKLREQMRLFKQMLQHAYDHTVYYKNLFDSLALKPADIQTIEDLKKLPVLTKKDLQEHYAELQADDITDFYEVSTGGTTGKPTHVLMERDAIWREWAFAYHYWSKFGYDFKTSRLATLRGVNLGKRQSEINPLYNEIRLNLFAMNRGNIRQYVRAAEKYGADFMYGYPSAVYNFCRLAREADIDLAGKFKAALLISENLYPFQKEVITAVLSCPIAIFYGHSERAVFAEEYGQGYLFQPLYGVTEIAADGTLVVTGFINGKMPLIRYEVDDRVEEIAGNTVIVGHRNSEYLYGANGERFRATLLDFHGYLAQTFAQYQFIQEKAGSCILNAVPYSDELNTNQIKEIEKKIRQKFGAAITCEIRIVKELEMTPRGKYQMVIQKETSQGGGKPVTALQHCGSS